MSSKAMVVTGGIVVLILIIVGMFLTLNKNDDLGSNEMYLVKDGQAQAVIIRQVKKLEQDALEEFRRTVQRATGVELPVIDASEIDNIPANQVRVIFGPGPIADSLGVDIKELDEEAFQILTVDNHLIFTGSASGSYLWAVSHYLDHYLGVRWLWPGEVGTYVPHHESIAISPMNIVVQPTMEIRRLRSQNTSPETTRWLGVHMMGRRATYTHGHAFAHWWDSYRDHPEYFAHPPAGKRQVRSDRVKLDLSNEAIDDVIIADWQKAGMPDNWNISPNDGPGFCISEGCLAMDEPANQSISDIWDGEGQQTARYVKFWNRLFEKMRVLNPNVTLSSYAYSSYRDAPPAGVKLNEGMILGFVHTPQAYEAWQGWIDAGAKMVLRPNWWHSAAGAPHLNLHEIGDFFKYATENGMSGFDFDSIIGYWGTQGLNYYLIARLSVRPELTVDEVIDEYASAFGHAAPAIKDYIAYWEEFSEKAAYTISAGNGVSVNAEGLFETTVRENRLPTSPLHAGWYVMPYMYPDGVFDEARSFLQKAEQLAANDDEYVQARIAFLQDGLREFELTRDVVRLGYINTRPVGATLGEFTKLREELYAFRAELEKRHVIWANVVQGFENSRSIPTHEDRTYGWRDPIDVPTSEEMDEQFQGM